MANKHQTLNAIHLIQMHRLQLTSNWNSDECCAICQYAKLSEAKMQVVRQNNIPLFDHIYWCRIGSLGMYICHFTDKHTDIRILL